MTVTSITSPGAKRYGVGAPVAPKTVGVVIRASHISELRSNLDEARFALRLAAMQYTDPALAAGDTIKAAHMRELRAGVK